MHSKSIVWFQYDAIFLFNVFVKIIRVITIFFCFHFLRKIVAKSVTTETCVFEEFYSVLSSIKYFYRVEFDTLSYSLKPPHVACHKTWSAQCLFTNSVCTINILIFFHSYSLFENKNLFLSYTICLKTRYCKVTIPFEFWRSN